ncbi:hypothetical protein JZ751_020174, partial [Albula glossodonta]
MTVLWNICKRRVASQSAAGCPMKTAVSTIWRVSHTGAVEVVFLGHLLPADCDVPVIIIPLR